MFGGPREVHIATGTGGLEEHKKHHQKRTHVTEIGGGEVGQNIQRRIKDLRKQGLEVSPRAGAGANRFELTDTPRNRGFSLHKWEKKIHDAAPSQPPKYRLDFSGLSRPPSSSELMPPPTPRGARSRDGLPPGLPSLGKSPSFGFVDGAGPSTPRGATGASGSTNGNQAAPGPAGPFALPHALGRTTSFFGGNSSPATPRPSTHRRTNSWHGAGGAGHTTNHNPPPGPGGGFGGGAALNTPPAAPNIPLPNIPAPGMPAPHAAAHAAPIMPPPLPHQQPRQHPQIQQLQQRHILPAFSVANPTRATAPSSVSYHNHNALMHAPRRATIPAPTRMQNLSRFYTTPSLGSPSKSHGDITKPDPLKTWWQFFIEELTTTIFGHPTERSVKDKATGDIAGTEKGAYSRALSGSIAVVAFAGCFIGAAVTFGLGIPPVAIALAAVGGAVSISVTGAAVMQANDRFANQQFQLHLYERHNGIMSEQEAKAQAKIQAKAEAKEKAREEKQLQRHDTKPKVSFTDRILTMGHTRSSGRG